MKHVHSQKIACAICNKRFEPALVRAWGTVRPPVSKLIESDVPDWSDGRFICRDDLAAYRRRHVEALLEEERGELSNIERTVAESFESGSMLSQNPQELIDERATLGDRMADRIAGFGGSWLFILSFVGILAAWVALNLTGWLFRPFDAYPFILLNLVLSCLAALQAPIILMSQKRQEAKDRLRAENDFKVDLKAELEVRMLHEKIDHQLSRQWERLAELQQIQIEMLEEQSASEKNRR